MYKNQIIVSVVMITYGHENYIEEAINSVLLQQLNFDVSNLSLLLIAHQIKQMRLSTIVEKR
jgi:glycosyltransferase involved in cell wall biosynthesis